MAKIVTPPIQHQLHVNVDGDTIKKLKIIALNRGTSMSEVVRQEIVKLTSEVKK